MRRSRNVVVLLALVASWCAGPVAAATRLSVDPSLGGGGGGNKGVLRRRPTHRRTAAQSTKNVVIRGGIQSPPQREDGAVRGVATLLGGTLTHVVLGSFYCVPSFVSYMPASLQYLAADQTQGKPDALLAMPLTLLVSACVMPLGAQLSAASPVATALAGGLVVALAVFLASFSTRCWHFLVSHGALFGVGHALGYTSPMVAGWRFYPKRRGLVSGTVLTGFGAAAFVWTPIITALMNPDNLAPPFPDTVSARFGPTLRRLAQVYCLVSGLGVAAMAAAATERTVSSAAGETPSSSGGVKVSRRPSAAKQKPLPAAAAATTEQQRSLLARFVPSRALAGAWALCLLVASASLNVAALWKGFATAAGSDALRGDDRALALAGSLAAVFNGVGRLFFATVSDSLGLGRTYVALIAIQTAAVLALGPVAMHLGPTAFAINLAAVFFVLGGAFSLSPPLCSALFGPVDGPKKYGLLFSAFPAASIGGQLLAQHLISLFGWPTVLRIYGVTSALAFLPLLALWDSLSASSS